MKRRRRGRVYDDESGRRAELWAWPNRCEAAERKVGIPSAFNSHSSPTTTAATPQTADEMAGTADAAKNAFNSIFDKTKDVLSTAADATKGYASQAQQAIGKIIPGASQDHDADAIPPASAPDMVPNTNATAAPPQ